MTSPEPTVADFVVPLFEQFHNLGWGRPHRMFVVLINHKNNFGIGMGTFTDLADAKRVIPDAVTIMNTARKHDKTINAAAVGFIVEALTVPESTELTTADVKAYMAADAENPITFADRPDAVKVRGMDVVDYRAELHQVVQAESWSKPSYVRRPLTEELTDQRERDVANVTVTTLAAAMAGLVFAGFTRCEK